MAEAPSDPTGSRFAQLLEDESAHVRTWAAHHLLELFTARSAQTEQLAVGVIEVAASGETLEAFGERSWLQEWRRSHQAGQLIGLFAASGDAKR
jgi:hypothetical protein